MLIPVLCSSTGSCFLSWSSSLFSVSLILFTFFLDFSSATVALSFGLLRASAIARSSLCLIPGSGQARHTHCHIVAVPQQQDAAMQGRC